MSPISVALTLWQAGLVPTRRLMAWANLHLLHVLQSDGPVDDWLELSRQGPAACLRLAEWEFPHRPVELGFPQLFALQAVTLDLASDAEVAGFVQRVAVRCMGHDLQLPEVELGYRLDHLLCDCDDLPAAIRLLRDTLPSLRSRNEAMVAELLEKVPGLLSRMPAPDTGTP